MGKWNGISGDKDPAGNMHETVARQARPGRAGEQLATNRVQGLEHNNTGHTTKCRFFPPTKKKKKWGDGEGW